MFQLKRFPWYALTSVVLWQIGNALPKPTNLDLLFYGPGLLVGLLAALMSPFWLARQIAKLIGTKTPESAQSVPADAVPIVDSAAQAVRTRGAESPDARVLAEFEYLSYHMAICQDPHGLLIGFYESDSEPLRPQRFFLSSSQVGEALQRLQEDSLYILEQGSDKLQLSLTQVETEDYYGKHFSLSLPGSWVDALRAGHSSLPVAGKQDRLRMVLDELQQGARERHDPMVNGALLELREDPELDSLVRPHLQGNADQALFAAAFLFARMNDISPLVEPMLASVENNVPSQTREAAEGTLAGCFAKQPETLTSEVLQRVVARIPWQSSPRTIGATLRVLAAAPQQVLPALSILQEQRAGLQARIHRSIRPEDQSVLAMLDRILEEKCR